MAWRFGRAGLPRDGFAEIALAEDALAVLTMAEPHRLGLNGLVSNGRNGRAAHA